MAPDLVAAPFFAASGLLLVAGGAKAARPGAASRALVSARLPGPRALVRILGFVEMAAGAAGLFDPGPVQAGAVALLYFGFALFLGFVLVSRVPSASCGCAGEREVPVSRLHIVLNLIAASSALVVAVRLHLWALPAFVLHQPLAGIPFLAGEAAIAVLAYLTVVYLPALFFSYRYEDARDVAPSAGPGRPGMFRLSQGAAR